MAFLSYTEDYQGVGDIFLHDPVRYHGFAQLLQAIMAANSQLTKIHKEMIALYPKLIS